MICRSVLTAEDAEEDFLCVLCGFFRALYYSRTLYSNENRPILIDGLSPPGGVICTE
jgi:hypothetical protein